MLDAQSLVSNVVTAPPVQRDLHQLVSVGDMRLVLQFSDAREYADGVGALLPVPRAPNWLLGMYSADGVATPLVDIEAWALQLQGISAAAGGAFAPRALRLADAADSWAIRVSQAPSVLDVATVRQEQVTNHLPLRVSATYGALMPYATAAVHLDDARIALRIDWTRLALHLKQELSGPGLQPLDKA